jgi:hypothetical protein
MDSVFEGPVAIRQRDEFDGPLFYWPLPSRTTIRCAAVPAFVVGTMIWVSVLVAGIQHLIAGRDPIQLVAFAAFALVVGLFLLGLWASLRVRPESVLLGHAHLVYDRGWNVASEICLYRVVTGTQPLFSKPGEARDSIHIPRSARCRRGSRPSNRGFLRPGCGSAFDRIFRGVGR